MSEQPQGRSFIDALGLLALLVILAACALGGLGRDLAGEAAGALGQQPTMIKVTDRDSGRVLWESNPGPRAPTDCAPGYLYSPTTGRRCQP